MPPLARMTVDHADVELLRDWIHSLPGLPVLDPPVISGVERSLKRTVRIALSDSEPGAEIHYTVDGSDPTRSDPIYEAPLELAEPKIVRARAFKQGFTRSITAQQIYVPMDEQ